MVVESNSDSNILLRSEYWHWLMPSTHRSMQFTCYCLFLDQVNILFLFYCWLFWYRHLHLHLAWEFLVLLEFTFAQNVLDWRDLGVLGVLVDGRRVCDHFGPKICEFGSLFTLLWILKGINRRFPCSLFAFSLVGSQCAQLIWFRLQSKYSSKHLAT